MLDIQRFQEGKKRHDIIISCVCVFFAGYFCYHILQGERGLISWLNLKKQVERDQKNLDILQETKHEIEQQVFLLGSHVDGDMLDQQVRSVLNFAYPDEVVIYDNE